MYLKSNNFKGIPDFITSDKTDNVDKIYPLYLNHIFSEMYLKLINIKGIPDMITSDKMDKFISCLNEIY